MLSSQSTQSKDPSAFPLCIPGTATKCGRPAGPATEDPGTAFDALFADLNRTESPEAAVAADLAALGLTGLGPPFTPPPVVMELIPSGLGAGAGAMAPAYAAAVEPDAADGVLLGAPDRRARALIPGEPIGDAGLGREFIAEHGDGAASDLVADGPAHPGLPADPNADRVTQTARPAGLPTAALEHRQAISLPPGLTRLQAQQVLSTTGSAADASADVTTLPLLPPEGEWPQLTAVPRGFRFNPANHSGTAPIGTVEPDGFATEEILASAPGTPVSPGREARLEEFLLGSRRPEPQPLPGAKIAADPAAAAESPPLPDGMQKKSFLTTDNEPFALRARTLGTGSAKPEAIMPTPSFNSAPTHPNFDYAMTGVTSAGTVVSGAAPVEELGDTFSSAHEAVEVVLHAVEHVASRAQKSVQLNFSVAGEELAVRVELRANEVRTTYRTDSAELRTALAQEWHTIAGTSTVGDRPARIAPAVFAAAEQSALNAFAGDTSSRGRQAGKRRDEAEPIGPRIRSRVAAPVAHPVALPTAGAPAKPKGTHRLQTLA